MIETLHLLADALLGAGTLFVWYRARRRSEGRTGDFARVLTQTLAHASAKGYTAEFTDDAFHLYYERWNKALLEKTRVTVLRIARADLDAGALLGMIEELPECSVWIGRNGGVACPKA